MAVPGTLDEHREAINITWSTEVPEHVRTEIGLFVNRYPELLPSGWERFVVAYGPNLEGGYMFTCFPFEEDVCLIQISRDWYSRPAHFRELDFVLDMLKSQYFTGGRLSSIGAELEPVLHLHGKILRGAEAATHIINTGVRLIERRECEEEKGPVSTERLWAELGPFLSMDSRNV